MVATDSGDTLQLAGTSAGSLSGLGSAFAHFSFIAENAHADWTLTGSNVLAAGESLSDAGVLTVTGSLTDAATASIKAGGEVTASGGGTILIDGVTLAGGVLTGSASGSIAIGLDPAGASGSRITVESGAFIGGFGAVNGAGVIDDGTVIARAGTLTVGVPISGTGALDIASGATLRTGGAVSVTNVHFNQGSGETLYVAKPTALSSTIAGFAASDTIDLKGIVATSLSFIAGTLTLYDGDTAVDRLTFAGDYTQADFMIMNDGQGGTDIHYGGSDENAILPPEPEVQRHHFPVVPDHAWRF